MGSSNMLFASVPAIVEEWEGVGHSVSAEWLEWAGRVGATGLGILLLFLLVRAFLRRHRYRAVDVLTKADVAAVHEELVAAEKRTVGEIVPVVLERSDAHPAANWISAVFTILVGCALLSPWLPWEHPLWLLLCQLVLGALGYGLARAFPGFRRAFVRESRATEMAQEQAMQEFYRHGLHQTEEKTGVLLFVSLLEQRVIVLADEGIDARVSAQHWDATNRVILEGVRAGSLRQGLVDGIRSAAVVLAEHFPWREGDRNEVPDRVIVRRE